MAHVNTLMKFEADQRRAGATTNPSCTGGSLFAIVYNGGVALAGDRQVSYGKMARYEGYSRLLKVNDRCVIAFNGDHSDFAFIQNTIETIMMEYRGEMNNPDAEMSPNAIHSYLTCLQYWRRCRIDPLYNTLLVAGITNDNKPFLATVNMRGVAYPQKYVAVGLGAMLLQQTLENEYRAKLGGSNNQDQLMTKDQAIALLKTCATIEYYKDCIASTDFEACTVGTDGVKRIVIPPKEVQGQWEQLAEACTYENDY